MKTPTEYRQLANWYVNCFDVVTNQRASSEHSVNPSKLLSAAVLSFAALASNSTFAAAVSCNDGAGPGLRELTISPGKVGGFCYTLNGNFNANGNGNGVTSYATIFGAGFGAVQIDRDQQSDASGNTYESWLTGYSSATSGNWTVAEDAWNKYQPRKTTQTRSSSNWHAVTTQELGRSPGPLEFNLTVYRTSI